MGYFVEKISDYGVHLLGVVGSVAGVLLLDCFVGFVVADQLFKQDADDVWRHHVLGFEVLVDASGGLSCQHYARVQHVLVGFERADEQEVYYFFLFFLFEGLGDFLGQSGRAHQEGFFVLFALDLFQSA